MLKALGYRFLDEKGEDAGEGGQALAKIVSVEISDKKQLFPSVISGLPVM